MLQHGQTPFGQRPIHPIHHLAANTLSCLGYLAFQSPPKPPVSNQWLLQAGPGQVSRLWLKEKESRPYLLQPASHFKPFRNSGQSHSHRNVPDNLAVTPLPASFQAPKFRHCADCCCLQYNPLLHK